MAAEGGLFITIVMIMMIIVLIIITGIMTIMTIPIMTIWLFLLKRKTAMIPNHGDSASERRKPGSQVEQLWLFFFLSCITE